MFDQSGERVGFGGFNCLRFVLGTMNVVDKSQVAQAGPYFVLCCRGTWINLDAAGTRLGAGLPASCSSFSASPHGNEIWLDISKQPQPGMQQG